LFFKIFFTQKYIKIIFFIFLKLFLILTSKKIKKILILNKKKQKNFKTFLKTFKIQKPTLP
jgi:hypothetical protein